MFIDFADSWYFPHWQIAHELENFHLVIWNDCLPIGLVEFRTYLSEHSIAPNTARGRHSDLFENCLPNLGRDKDPP